MTSIPVFIIDPVADLRDALALLLDADPRLEVIGTCASVAQAREQIERRAPRIILIDAAVAGMRRFVDETMVERPVPIVLLVDPERPVEDAVLALRDGALSVQLRPGSTANAASGQRFRDLVVALAEVRVVRRRPRRSPASEHGRRGARASNGRSVAKIVAVAASTGGPTALQRLLAVLPVDLPMPVLVVQHLAVGFSDQLVSTLGAASALPVKLAQDGEEARAGVVHLAPDGHHLHVDGRGRLWLRDDEPEGGFRPSATVLFSSVAQHYGPAAIAVVLSGMGSDGLRGLHAVHAAGGVVLAQDEASAVVYGMPGVAVAAGLTQHVAPVEELAAIVAARGTKERP